MSLSDFVYGHLLFQESDAPRSDIARWFCSEMALTVPPINKFTQEMDQT